MDSVSVYYRSLPALRDVSFALTAPKRVGVVGPKGLGKSTLLRCLAGVARPSAGLVTFNCCGDRLTDLPVLTGVWRVVL